jgi:hypothetical protein
MLPPTTVLPPSLAFLKKKSFLLFSLLLVDPTKRTGQIKPPHHVCRRSKVAGDLRRPQGSAVNSTLTASPVLLQFQPGDRFD